MLLVILQSKMKGFFETPMHTPVKRVMRWVLPESQFWKTQSKFSTTVGIFFKFIVPVSLEGPWYTSSSFANPRLCPLPHSLPFFFGAIFLWCAFLIPTGALPQPPVQTTYLCHLIYWVFFCLLGRGGLLQTNGAFKGSTSPRALVAWVAVAINLDVCALRRLREATLTRV